MNDGTAQFVLGEPPQRPEGLRIVFLDGHVIPITDLVYTGKDRDGTDRWVAVLPTDLPLRPGLSHLQIDSVPSHCQVEIGMRP